MSIPKGSDAGKLREALAAETKIPAERIVIAQMMRSYLYKFFDDETSLDFVKTGTSVRVRACAWVGVRGCARACACACVHACTRVRMFLAGGDRPCPQAHTPLPPPSSTHAPTRTHMHPPHAPTRSHIHPHTHPQVLIAYDVEYPKAFEFDENAGRYHRVTRQPPELPKSAIVMYFQKTEQARSGYSRCVGVCGVWVWGCQVVCASCRAYVYVLPVEGSLVLE